MRVKRFADRVPERVLEFIEQAGDIEIINLFDTANRTVVYYVEKLAKGRKPRAERIEKDG